MDAKYKKASLSITNTRIYSGHFYLFWLWDPEIGYDFDCFGLLCYQTNTVLIWKTSPEVIPSPIKLLFVIHPIIDDFKQKKQVCLIQI
jgi:hypothetical protein